VFPDLKRLIKFEKKIMATVTLNGTPAKISGNLPAKGSKAPDFSLVKTDLSTLSLSDLKGKKLILSISPSLDTGICATSVRKFNQTAASMKNTVVLAITKDLPFAAKRFCTTEGITNVVSLSGFRDTAFGKAYGIEILEGNFTGLYARCLVVVNEQGVVTHSQLVPEIATEADYDAALAAL
jgi:thiol peroxidase